MTQRLHDDARDAAGALSAMVDKYRMLDELGGGEPGRTVGRRDAMRAIAARFPAALREWDEAPPEEIRRRRGLVDGAQARVLGGESVEAALDGEEMAFARFGAAVHERLRRALEVKRWLAGRALSPSLVTEAAGRFAVDAATVAMIAAPPSGRVSEEIYCAVAIEHGVTVSSLKRALFPLPHRDADRNGAGGGASVSGTVASAPRDGAQEGTPGSPARVSSPAVRES